MLVMKLAKAMEGYIRSTDSLMNMASLIDTVWTWHQCRWCDCNGDRPDPRCAAADMLTESLAKQLHL